MGRIQSSVGLITGVAIDETVNRLMELNALPRNRLQARTQTLTNEQVAVTELTALVIAIELTSDRLGQATLFDATKVNASNASVTARSSGSPKLGSYSFVPVRRAQNQQLTSGVFASPKQTLSAGEVSIHGGGFLDESVRLDALNGGSGVARGSIRITDRSGESAVIDLRFAQTSQDVVDAINANDSLKIVAKLDGDRFTLSDLSSSTVTNLQVSEVGTGTTAADLGLATVSTTDSTASGSSVFNLASTTAVRSLRDGRGLEFETGKTALNITLADSTNVAVKFDFSAKDASLGQIVDAINASGEGKLLARISNDGKGLAIEDLTIGSSTFSISNATGNVADQLGLRNPAENSVVQGTRLIGGLSDVLLSSLNGGRGFDSLGSISISDRSGAAATVDLSQAQTITDVLSAINSAGIGVSAKLNRTQTGIELVDTTGSTTHNFVVANVEPSNTATQLQIESDVAANKIDSRSLKLQHITRNTLLSKSPDGSSIAQSSFTVKDSAGRESTINLRADDAQTFGDVIDGINRANSSVEARINDEGDGIVIIDRARGGGVLTIADIGSGTAARQLGIAGEASRRTIDGASVSAINGSTTVKIQTTNDTTLEGLVESLNAYGSSPVSASILRLGQGDNVRLLMNSRATGALGRVAIESTVGLDFNVTAKAQDALISFGATEAGGGVLVSSSTNTFNGVVEDLQLTINDTSTSAVTVTVESNSSTLVTQLETFVTSYNNMRDRLSSFTSFDPASNSVGVLFGSNAALRIDVSYNDFLSGRVFGAGSIRSLGELGLRLNDRGRMELDKTKLQAAIDTDSGAVKEFFTKAETGFSARAKKIAQQIAGTGNSVLLTRNNSLQTQIEQNTRRIGTLETRLDNQRERLLAQFYGMEEAIAKLQSNLTAINGIRFISRDGTTR